MVVLSGHVRGNGNAPVTPVVPQAGIRSQLGANILVGVGWQHLHRNQMKSEWVLSEVDKNPSASPLVEFIRF